jgi:Icc-related predicted phosphoesterase
MKFQIMSDLHLEHHADGGAHFLSMLKPTAPVLILAGDCFSLTAPPISVLASVCEQYGRVFYVPGNHEYYGTTPRAAEAALMAIEGAISALAVLRTGEVHEHGGLRFLGDTMWFPRPSRYVPGLADYRFIQEFEPWVYERNAAFRAWLRAELREGDVVVTHHAPSRRSVAPRFYGSPANCYFVCDMEAEISQRKPALWAHGHMHSAVDYVLDATRVVCNPLGYPGENAGPFNHGFVVEC